MRLDKKYNGKFDKLYSFIGKLDVRFGGREMGESKFTFNDMLNNFDKIEFLVKWLRPVSFKQLLGLFDLMLVEYQSKVGYFKDFDDFYHVEILGGVRE